MQILQVDRRAPLLRLRKNNRHGFRMDLADFRVGVGGEKSEKLMLASIGIALVPRSPFHAVQIPAKTASGRSSERKPGRRFRGLVSAYSQNEVNGTTQRFSGLSHGRQCGP